MIVVEWILIVILSISLILFCMWMWTGLRAQVPFVPVPSATLSEIEKALDIKEGSVVYDLGCGDGRVLFALAKHHKDAYFIGIENGALPVLLAKVRVWMRGNKNKAKVEILDKDFFTQDLSKATHIFTYLYPQVMDNLLTKLENEVKSGTRLVSATFFFTLKKPIAEINLKRGKYQLVHKLYVYEF